MKKLIIASFLLISMKVSAQSMSRNYSNDENKKTTRIALTLGGVGFTIAGFLTPPIYTGQNTTNPNVQVSHFANQKQTQLPFYQQGPRFGCIVTGITLTASGLISMIAGR